jgi:hypothetical protein
LAEYLRLDATKQLQFRLSALKNGSTEKERSIERKNERKKERKKDEKKSAGRKTETTEDE